MSIFMFSVALKCELILVAELCADKKINHYRNKIVTLVIVRIHSERK